MSASYFRAASHPLGPVYATLSVRDLPAMHGAPVANRSHYLGPTSRLGLLAACSLSLLVHRGQSQVRTPQRLVLTICALDLVRLFVDAVSAWLIGTLARAHPHNVHPFAPCVRLPAMARPACKSRLIHRP